MKAFRKIVAVFLSFVFIPGLVALLFLLGLRLTLLQPSFYKTILNESDFYKLVLQEVTDRLEFRLNIEAGSNQEIVIKGLEGIVKQVLTEEKIRSITESSIDQAFKALNSTNDDKEIYLSVAEVKKEIKSALYSHYASVPSCASLPSSQRDNFNCVPVQADEIGLENYLDGIISLVPDKINLLEGLEENENISKESFNNLSHNYFRAQIIFWALFTILLGLVFIIPLIAVGFNMNILLWQAVLLLFPGLIYTLGSLGVKSNLGQITDSIEKGSSIDCNYLCTSPISIALNKIITVYYYEGLGLLLVATALIIINRVFYFIYKKKS